MLRELGLSCEVPVGSPTFALMQRYDQTRVPVVHADFYRVENQTQTALEALSQDQASSSVLVVEWGEWLRSAFSEGGLELTFGYQDGDRVLDAQPWGPRGTRLVSAFVAE